MTENKIRIRAARAADQAQIDQLWARCRRASGALPIEPPTLQTPTKSGLFVALHGEAQSESKLVGSVLAQHDGDRGWLHYLAVDPHCPCTGLGQRLVCHAQDWLGAKGIRNVQLLVQSSNLDIRGFYQRFGHAHSDVVDLHHMVGDALADPA
ncbi:hypothetical protein JCM17960_21300 [Magnetospira thiophila]